MLVRVDSEVLGRGKGCVNGPKEQGRYQANSETSEFNGGK